MSDRFETDLGRSKKAITDKDFDQAFYMIPITKIETLTSEVDVVEGDFNTAARVVLKNVNDFSNINFIKYRIAKHK